MTITIKTAVWHAIFWGLLAFVAERIRGETTLRAATFSSVTSIGWFVVWLVYHTSIRWGGGKIDEMLPLFIWIILVQSIKNDPNLNIKYIVIHQFKITFLVCIAMYIYVIVKRFLITHTF